MSLRRVRLCFAWELLVSDAGGDNGPDHFGPVNGPPWAEKEICFELSV